MCLDPILINVEHQQAYVIHRRHAQELVLLVQQTQNQLHNAELQQEIVI
jgi:hypothetical protein